MLEGYDIIGDIHGHAALLEKLLGRLGYEKRHGVWKHRTRQALFLGDLIDRGDESVRTVQIVRAMTDGGSARCIMGNHEFNARWFAAPDPDRPGDFLRRHNEKNLRQHGKFLKEAGFLSPLHRDILTWFSTLPLWLELDALCMAHACWDRDSIERLASRVGKDGVFSDDEMLEERRRVRSLGCCDSENICKGPEVSIAHAFLDKDGTERRKARICWWQDDAPSDRGWIMRSAGFPEETELLEPCSKRWPHDKPVFFGHYWLNPRAPRSPMNSTSACLDYSAGKGGPLVCYRFDCGDRALSADRFVAADPE